MTSASRIQHRVAFSELVQTPDGIGGFTTSWIERLTAFVEYKHLRGSEAVLAGRIAGTHTQIMRVRSTTEALAINTTWKATDANGKGFNIRDVTPTEDRKWLDILAESGVAI